MKKGLIAQERDRADIRLARRDRTVRRQPFMRDRAHRLVFLDETSVKANMTRLRGRSAVGERLFGTTPFGRWKTQTFIAGLTCDALIAPRVIEGAMNRAAFDIHVETRLAPALSPGTVFVGNSIHWTKSFLLLTPRHPLDPQEPESRRDPERPWLPVPFSGKAVHWRPF